MSYRRLASARGSFCRCTGAAAAALLLIVTTPAEAGRKGDRSERASDVLAELSDLVARSSAKSRHRRPDAPEDEDYYERDELKEALGRLLFHDKILSGNQNISCATCHHPLTDTGDGLSLPVGEGAQGLGVTRNTGGPGTLVPERVPRNAPHVFNLGAKEFTVMFHDGRVEEDPDHPSGFRSPAGDDLPVGLDNVLAVQAMFPVTSGTEMAGQNGENPIGTAAHNGLLAGESGVWEQLAGRLRGIPEYVGMFVAAFDDVGGPADIQFVHAANAIAAYEAAAFRASNSPYDRYLRGEHKAMSQSQHRGRHLFYGAAGCGDCHSGAFQTDHQFYAIGMPQIGPGKGDNLPGYDDGHDDFGRERVTLDPDDRFRFRVPSLRNVALTGPWGHDGAYDSLEAVVRHHLDPIGSLNGYDTEQAVLPPRPDLDAADFACHNDGTRRGAIAAACELAPRGLSDEQVKQLVDFLHALTDPDSLDLRDEVPMEVPSGLPMFD
jgi:cytochrome c peroxidase